MCWHTLHHFVIASKTGVQFSSVTQSCLTPCDTMNRSRPGLPVHHQLPEFTQTHVHRVGDAIQQSHPLLSPFPPAPNPSQHQIFSNESTLHMRWPKYRSFSFSIIPCKEQPGLIFRMDWLDLLAVQGTLKSLLQYHSSKASILRHSAFFTVQLLHPYMTSGKTIALTRRPFVGKVMSLLFNMPSRLVITFLPRSKRLLISWLQSPSAVILEPQKIKSDTVSTVSPSNPLQYSSLKNSEDRGTWWAAVYGVAKSQPQLSTITSRTGLLISKKSLMLGNVASASTLVLGRANCMIIYWSCFKPQ